MNELIKVIPKNAAEELHVSLTEYRGHRLVDIRVFFKPEDGGEFKPTRKGITLRTVMMGEIIEALRRAQEVAEAEPPA